MEKKFCLNCFKQKLIDDFGLENSKNPAKGYRSKCKECCTEIEARRFYESMLEKYPDNYWECDVCDHIVKVKKKICTKCKQPRGTIDYSLPGRGTTSSTNSSPKAVACEASVGSEATLANEVRFAPKELP
jgi:hypothetical protein